MKSYIQPGDTLTLTAPYVRTSGQMAKVGSILAVAADDVANAAEGEFKTTGVFNITKLTADVVAVGDKLYWDDTNKRLTLTSTANTLAGVATAAADGSATTVNVRLNGSF